VTANSRTARDRGPAAMRFAVDGWDPGYGSSLDVDEGAESVSRVVNDVEREPDRWGPVPATPVEAPDATVFVDGVRRIDARVWVAEPPPRPREASGQEPMNEATVALCASYAAGAVCCCGAGAHVLDEAIQVRRGLFTAARQAQDLATWAGTYAVFPTVIDPARGVAISLSASLQHQLTTLEIGAAVAARARLAEHGVPDQRGLLVVDGPVRGRDSLPRVLGLIKSHQIAYLEPRLHAVVGTLGATERTPVFLLGTSWDRFTWYLRLPCPPAHPWAGVVRIECAANRPAAEVIALANLSQAVIPRFASVEYKDARAPQNLYPVAGLERELRRRLGHSGLLYRALREAAAAST
jgi:hypothetical protein